MLRLGTITIGSALLACACVGSEVTYTGTKYPAKGRGCPVEIFPSTTPAYRWEDIATVESHCHFTNGRSACIQELKKRVCEAGGDTLYGLKDGRQGENILVIATIARRTGDGEIEKTGGEPRHPGSSGARESAKAGPLAQSCDPPCSPGYRCEASQCIALCNPPCGEGMRCNQQRMCESVAESSPKTPPSQ